MGDAIAVLLGAYRLTVNDKYIVRADQFDGMAIDLFFDDSPLPRASSRHAHYEAITRGDTLVIELLGLWAVMNQTSLDFGFVYNDR